ncbi:MAG: hydroxyacid dehydrogenase [Alphaproteobacteria bacterium]|nr:hydroxyacid dehydrogenase [Alphaproteobacteria bacterium]MCW5742639.1 hydroxyacid dehydrogenase [Alphaproteobacteria bacterium]
MPWTIAITGPDLAKPGLDVLNAAGCRVHFVADNSSDAELLALVRKETIDGILARHGVSGNVIRAGDSIRCISRHGAGYNSVDIPAATAKRIPVLVAAGVNAQSVAELTIGLMIAVARAIPTHDANLRGARWIKGPAGVQLGGRTMGIVGLGAVGKRVARAAAGLGLKVMAYDPYINAVIEGVERVASLGDLLARAEVLSLHCPLTEETEGMIGAAQLAALPRGAVLLNAARGPVVDEGALVAALRAGHLLGAGLDTFRDEPPAPDCALLGLPNVVLSPHIGAHTGYATDAVSATAAENLLRVLDGKPVDPALCVNRAVLA